MEKLNLIILIIASIVSIISLVISIKNLNVSIKNRRNSLRDRVNEKQIDFFLITNEYVAALELQLSYLDKEYSDDKDVLQKITAITNELDFHFSKNEIIIPDEVYKVINDYISFVYKNTTTLMKDPLTIHDLESGFREIGIRLQDEIREYLNVEHLSRENKTLGQSH